jgi:hypothetical protein
MMERVAVAFAKEICAAAEVSRDNTKDTKTPGRGMDFTEGNEDNEGEPLE